MTSGIPGCGGACVLPSPAPLCRRDPQHCSPTLSEAPLLRAHAQNTSAHQWASHPDHDEDWPQVQMSVTVTPTWSPVRPRQVTDGPLWFVTSRQDGHPLQNEDLLASAAGCPSGCGASQLADVLLLPEPEEQSVLPEADHLLRPGQLLRDCVC
uniref:Lymphocyte antigen 6 family member E n=1 Tax=Nomascus leucogenys TaxID=61853 RepID=A0A2I3HUX7_NOMLE